MYRPFQIRNGTSIKVQLINAPNGSRIAGAGSQGCFPHLGLISIATVVKARCPDVEIEVLDGTLLDIDSLCARIDGHIVGVSALTMTYDAALLIARTAKARGALVLLGNDHASRFAHVILSRRDYVDGVFIGDFAEEPFARLVCNVSRGLSPFEDVKGVIFRALGQVMKRPEIVASMDGISLPDRRLLNHEPYIRNFNARFSGKHGRTVRNTISNTMRGCVKRNSRCQFCDIYSLDIRSYSPIRTWEEWTGIVASGFDWVWEVCDDFGTFDLPQGPKGSHLDQLLACRPDAPTPSLFVYSRASGLSPTLVAKYVSLGVSKVNVGMESGDGAMLRSLHKGNPRGNEDNVRAATLLREAGIQMHVSFVLGAPGESEESLTATIDLAQMLIGLGHVTSMDPSVLLPLPGAPVWRVLGDTRYAHETAARFGLRTPDLSVFAEFLDTDAIDTSLLSRRWVDNFCHCSYEAVRSAAMEINRLISADGGAPGAFGVSGFDDVEA